MSLDIDHDTLIEFKEEGSTLKSSLVQLAHAVGIFL